MTARFIRLLRRMDPGITATEIADVLWLWCQIETAGTGETGPSAEKPDEPESPEPSSELTEDAHTAETDADSLQCRPARIYPRARRGFGAGDGPGAHPIRSPGVHPLPGRLEIARAFRPLKQHTASRRQWEIDVPATAERMADTRIHWPVLRPVRERWLDLALVVEEARSMVIWRPVVRAFRKLLHRTGVFRKIETWKFSVDSREGHLVLHRGDGGRRPAGAMIGPERRRLVLVVSDCISGGWRNGSAARLMDGWTKDAMVALVQLFPEHLWQRTALGRAEPVRLRMRAAGAPNRSMVALPPLDWDMLLSLEADFETQWKAPDGPKIPVFPLEPPYIHAWAESLAGLRYFELPGVVLDRKGIQPQTVKPDSAESPSVETLIDRFTTVASPSARRLAAYLAAAPLVMPIMRLVQAVMLPDSRQSHLAEVMLSGLIRRVTPEGAGTEEDEVLYDFVDGARERFLAMSRISESVKVLEIAMGKIRDFMDARTGRPLISFRALLEGPSKIGTFRLEGNSRAFAEISVFVLRRLGGFYAEIAERIEKEIGGEGTDATSDTAPAHGDILEIHLGKSKTPMRFIYIEPGEFLMGSPSDEPGRVADREKQHQVILTEGFYMQETPVTQGQWEAVMGSNPANFKDGGPDCPVEQVSWEDVQEFLGRLNSESAEWEYRLPTEAQWEYACRAGTMTPFWTGRCLSTEEANYDGNYPLEGCPKGVYREKTTPVKTFAPNPWGLYDMHGNVYEWCADWFGDYSDGPVTDPTGPNKGAVRVFRGGSWSLSARDCRSAYRSRNTPDSRYDFLGFRVLAVRRAAGSKSSP